MSSDEITGYFVRRIQPGTFSLTLSNSEYSRTIENVTVSRGQKTYLGIIELNPTNIFNIPQVLSTKGLSVKTSKDMIIFNNKSTSDASFELFNLKGSKVKTFTVKKGNSAFYTVPYSVGIYLVTAKNQTTSYSKRITVW
jgi:hypothetical protein